MDVLSSKTTQFLGHQMLSRSESDVKTLIEALESKSETENLQKLKEAVLNVDASLYGSEVSGLLAANEIVNALSRCELPKETKRELSEAARKVWKGWQVNLSDIELVRNSRAIASVWERMELRTFTSVL